MNVLAIGEILWDVIDDQKFLGGAPFNVLSHLKKMGHRASLFSSIGNDKLGKEIQSELERSGILSHFVHQGKYPTGTVQVMLTEGQPDYIIHENVAWDYFHFTEKEQNELRKETYDLIIFGMLAQRRNENAEIIKKVIADANAGHIFFDINIRKNFYSKEKLEQSLSICTILKVNEDEMMLLRTLFYHQSDELRGVVESIAKDFSIQLICVTRGGDGAWAYANKKWYKEEAPQAIVVDTIGAGDSFSAAFLHTYLRTLDVQSALRSACKMGSFVASQAGAIPEYSLEIKKTLGINT